MSEPAGQTDRVLGSRVTLTGWDRGRTSEVAETLELVLPDPVDLAPGLLPMVVLDAVPADKAERVRNALAESGGEVSVEEVRATRADIPDARGRPVCPQCGSGHTQPFTHAGPAARVNMRCVDCGYRFRDARSRG
ncbi:MAG: hypothetical protein WD739_07195 [Actinomycetota bacterium]